MRKRASTATRTTASDPRPSCEADFLHGEVSNLGAENAQAASFRRQSRLLRRPIPMLLEIGIAREQQSHVVGLGASGRECSAGACGQSGLGAEPANQFLLDDGGDRRLVEGIHRLIERADDDLRGQSGQEGRAVQVGGGAGMADEDRIRDDRAQRGGDLLGGSGDVGKQAGGDQFCQGRGIPTVVGRFGQRGADDLSGLRHETLVQSLAFLGGCQKLRFEQACLIPHSASVVRRDA